MRSRFVLILPLILYPLSLSFAAVAVDTTGSAFSAGDAASVTLSYTVTGSNTLALCGVAVNSGTNLTSMTWGGVGMTLVQTENPFGTYFYSLYRMTGVSGTNDFVASVSPDTGYLGIGCATFTGVDPTTPLGTAVVANFPSNITVTVPANGMAADFAGDHPSDCTSGLSPGSAGQTQLYSVCGDLAQDVLLHGSYRTTSGDFTWEQYFVQIGVPINPVAAAVSSNRRAIVVQ